MVGDRGTGGGLSVNGAALHVYDSALIENQADADGTGLLVVDTEATLTNVTVSGSPSAGSAVANFANTTSSLTIENSTIANNGGVAVRSRAWRASATS